MAFNTNNAAASVAPGPTNENWKAQGFLNFYLTTANGGRAKLGAIPLKVNKPKEKTLIEWLNEDPSRAQVILSKLEIEYQSAVPADGSGFALEG